MKRSWQADSWNVWERAKADTSELFGDRPETLGDSGICGLFRERRGGGIPFRSEEAIWAVVAAGLGVGGVTGTVYQSVAGGISFLIDGKYLGVARDSSPIGTHHLVHVFPSAPATGSHTVTYYLVGEESTTSATGTFTAP